MRFKAIVLALVALVATSAIASAQSQTGEIFGKVTDSSGGVLPGVTVTVTGPVLLQPLTAVTSETGSYQVPRLEIGGYTAKIALTGFKTASQGGPGRADRVPPGDDSPSATQVLHCTVAVLSASP